jgi:hypothetical protein
MREHIMFMIGIDPHKGSHTASAVDHSETKAVTDPGAVHMGAVRRRVPTPGELISSLGVPNQGERCGQSGING